MVTAMNDEARRILELLAQGKITVDEADQLLRAIGQPAASAEAASADAGAPRPSPRWVKILIDKPGREGREPKQVAIKVPMSFVRGGVKFGSIFTRMEPINRHLREQGIEVDFSKLDSAHLENVLTNLGETTIDIDEGKGRGTAHIRITCE